MDTTAVTRCNDNAVDKFIVLSKIPLVASRHDMLCVSRRTCSNMANDEGAVALACTSLVFCALNLRKSQEQLLDKVRWTYPTQSTLWRRPCRTRVMRVAPVVLSDKRDTARYDFFLCQNTWATCRVVK